ncbi:hypothetical protein OHA21_51085 [Actinoplanes sp. NBC_00393]|uniref:hypothetical protein n=1 Tax=Actinoplanes sp. NBC_00393 TaxID=2975953 RepID=UPI002E21CB42
MSDTTLHAVFLGAGPAGTGPLVNAEQRGLLPRLLDAGVAVVDQGDRMGPGTIGRHLINSDTAGGTFLECLAAEGDLFAPVTDSEPYRRLEQYRQSAAPLPVVSDFLAEIGAALRGAVDAHPVSRFLPRTRAMSIRRTADGGFATTLASGDDIVELRSRYVISALGGHQDAERALTDPIVPGVRLADGYAERVVRTEQVLTAGGPDLLGDMLTAAGHHRVVIVGGSHSAFSAAWVLLNQVGGEFGPGDITILHRRPPRIFYPTAEDAHAEGYTEFGPDDLCPLTQRVYRLAGLRWDSRDLLRGIRSGAEERVRLVPLDPAVDDGVTTLLKEAAVIIPAFGYRPVTVPVFDEDGRPVPLHGTGPGTPPLVDTRCRVLDADGEPVPGLFGIGLASGFMLDGPLGGEPSFRGQTNGLWLYQNGIGERILDQLLATA